MTTAPRVISNRNNLDHHYHRLATGDIIFGKIPMKAGEEHMLFDLASRGVRCIPSATAQLTSRSKRYQALTLSPWMLPETTVVYDIHQLLALCNHYHRKSITTVVVKQEGKNGGVGILRYGSIEDVFNQAASDCLVFPFILQPFLDNSVDMRVIILGPYKEAYRRVNPHCFRNNLHCGGTAEPCDLSDPAEQLCREVMARADCPYGHLDLLLAPQGKIYLSEINLRGGLRGAKISTPEYRRRVTDIENKLLEKMMPRL